jgi:hypothetical protein
MFQLVVESWNKNHQIFPWFSNAFPMVFPWFSHIFRSDPPNLTWFFHVETVPNLAMLGAETDAEPAVPEFYGTGSEIGGFFKGKTWEKTWKLMVY